MYITLHIFSHFHFHHQHFQQPKHHPFLCKITHISWIFFPYDIFESMVKYTVLFCSPHTKKKFFWILCPYLVFDCKQSNFWMVFSIFVPLLQEYLKWNDTHLVFYCCAHLHYVSQCFYLLLQVKESCNTSTLLLLGISPCNPCTHPVYFFCTYNACLECVHSILPN